MRDDRDGSLVIEATRGATSAQPTAKIIPFPSRRPSLSGSATTTADDRAAIAATEAICTTLSARNSQHGPTLLAAMGALCGFAIQQMLLLDGGLSWAQPKRAEHLDRLLLSETPRDSSLWFALQAAAHGIGAQHLPDPNTLLQATLRCVGTTQFGLVTLPLEYKLLQQPQATLCEIWASVSQTLRQDGVSAALLPSTLIRACALCVAKEQRHVPAHVALRILMQSALAMALIEPRTVPGAALRSQVN